MAGPGPVGLGMRGGAGGRATEVQEFAAGHGVASVKLHVLLWHLCL